MRFPPAEGGISGGADFVRLVSPLSAEASAFRGPESPISNKSLGFSIGFPFKGVYEATATCYMGSIRVLQYRGPND